MRFVSREIWWADIAGFLPETWRNWLRQAGIVYIRHLFLCHELKFFCDRRFGKVRTGGQQLCMCFFGFSYRGQ
ncbi:MAG: hypothetical protein CMJ81_03100 [Planctomycetaceae bacterium]|nr:hypothetical protein [Planctomycetaceae bacterium]